jgi:6-phosphofructokinase 2
MTSIATLTMNPTIDVAYDVDRVRHTRKMRAEGERVCPGGGGINVARVFARLGGNASCYYLSGGAMGAAFDGLVKQHGLTCRRIAIAQETRVSLAVLERASGKEYRFVPRGPMVAESEWRECLEQLAKARCDYVVASGSLPRGVPSDFYARLAGILRTRAIPLVLDSSGEALREGLAAGSLLLVKPSLGELRELVGSEVESPEDIADAALGIVGAGQAELVAVTMGHRGAVLASSEGAIHLPAIEIETKSAVGAGDSFLAGMVHALGEGRAPLEAFRYGMAAGAAAVLTPGTALAFPEDIERLHALGGEIRDHWQ